MNWRDEEIWPRWYTVSGERAAEACGVEDGRCGRHRPSPRLVVVTKIVRPPSCF